MPYDNTNNSMQKLAEACYAVTPKYQTANPREFPNARKYISNKIKTQHKSGWDKGCDFNHAIQSQRLES